jgi:hypothetical protein
MARRATATTRVVAKPTAANSNTSEQKFTTQLYYGMVTISHHDANTTATIGDAVRKLMDELKIRATVSVLWVFHKDGEDSIQSRWDGTKWVKVNN